jgi:hypothetical protein
MRQTLRVADGRRPSAVAPSHASAIALQAESRPDGDHRPDRSTVFLIDPFSRLDLGRSVRKTVGLVWRWRLAAGWRP